MWIIINNSCMVTFLRPLLSSSHDFFSCSGCCRKWSTRGDWVAGTSRWGCREFVQRADDLVGVLEGVKPSLLLICQDQLCHVRLHILFAHLAVWCTKGLFSFFFSCEGLFCVSFSCRGSWYLLHEHASHDGECRGWSVLPPFLSLSLSLVIPKNRTF